MYSYTELDPDYLPKLNKPQQVSFIENKLSMEIKLISDFKLYLEIFDCKILHFVILLVQNY